MGRTRWFLTVGLSIALVAGGSGAVGAAAPTPTRYSLVHGCYALTQHGVPVLGAARVRMQATALGRYLLYTPDRRFVAARPLGLGVGTAATPSDAADWRVDEAGAGTFMLTTQNGAATLRDVAFRATDGCADYPEAELDATGTPSKGDTSYGRVSGLLEGHMHWMTYQFLGGRFHCGRPWSPYGIPYALPNCSSIEGPQGLLAPMQNFLNYGNPVQPHDTAGWPTLASWTPENLTYEGTYWKWIQRAWMAGLRLMVMSPNENRILCLLQVNRQTDCDEMATVRGSLQAIHDLQDYVDAQSGGPGKGFFEIVTDPEQARRVINQGRMAVVLEVEVSEPFGCSGTTVPTCDQAQVDQQLDELHRLGVRSMLLLNKFDNPLTGVRFDGGPVGLLINAGNLASAGSFWSAQTCQGPLHDNDIYSPLPQVTNLVGSLFSAAGLPSGIAPAYPPAPNCNTRGLTDLGAHVVRRMMDLHMIVNPDHMSQAGVDRTLGLLEARHYSGVISPHGWMDPGNWPRIWKLGGLAFPGHSAADDYVKQWREYRPRQTPYQLGWGYGADLGGLSEQPGTDGDGGGIAYPFKGLDGAVTFDRQKTGDRTFDYNADGVAHYGLYADWFADLRRVGGDALVKDMMSGAEAYLEMWERAEGVATPGCADASGAIDATGRGALRLGTAWEDLLTSAGQPQQRDRAWSYCVGGAGNEGRADVAELTTGGDVELVGSTAAGRSAGGIAVGTRAGGTPGAPAAVRTIPRPDGGAWAYLVKNGAVAAVATAAPALARDPSALTAAMTRLAAATATQRTAPFEASADQAAQQADGAAPTGQPLVGAGDAQVTAALSALCHLQLSLPS
ncbi:MAG TPA: Coagulation factor 5/8 type domain-containing protein [Baekduia sp.]|uniref:Coagulation factor 5/8 type domain-containing protein n=1 Tax=Baekduia sp. TaxID=2600305 RepID=UPI002D775538|nr:Coagulation factor 5/8 type domain-containing protein [Baekduia sp.]HET6509180.1 Coagulation factor 5/8 type domain-containing protein [Baekduia sp.]